MPKWDKIRLHLIKHGFLHADHFLAPLGVGLLDNLAKVWLKNCQHSLNIPVLPALLRSPQQKNTDCQEDMISEAARVGRQQALTPPFGLAFNGFSSRRDVAVEPAASSTSSSASSDGLCLCLCLPQRSADDWFSTLQRRRRIWWRELAADPANYSLHGAASRGATVAELRYVESLCVEKLACTEISQTTKTARHSSPTVAIFSGISRDAALWALCSDALQQNPPVLSLSPKLSPLQRAFLATGINTERLRALTTHLIRKSRSAGVTVFPAAFMRQPSRNSSDVMDHVTDSTDDVALPIDETAEINTENGGGDSAESEHQKQKDTRWLQSALIHIDGAGVLETVFIEDATLVSGVCRIRSRDTGLCHEVHVSSLV